MPRRKRSPEEKAYAYIKRALSSRSPKLDLSNRNLTNLPSLIGKLTDPRELRLFNNKLTTLPEDIGQLKHLEGSRFLPDKLKSWHAMLAISATLSASVALAEDFKTVTGKVYKDATVSRIEADGIELKTKTGISKVYFTELPQDVQERFHWAKPEPPREPFYSRWAAAAEDPAALAKIIAAGASIIASVALVIGHIRSRRQPTIGARRTSRRRGVHRARS